MIRNKMSIEEFIKKDLLTISKIPQDDEQYKTKFRKIGERKKIKTVIFDLDETLIFSKELNGAWHYLIRPHVEETLAELSNYYEIVLFTSSEKSYADEIVDRIEKENKYFCMRFYREDCVCVNDHFIKDLRIIEDRNINDMIIVDNSIISFAYQLENGIPILPFNGEKNDKALLSLLSNLLFLKNIKDIRTENKKKFNLQEKLDEILLSN